jgi:hypothetical protein
MPGRFTGASEIVIETFTAREGYLSVLNTAPGE